MSNSTSGNSRNPNFDVLRLYLAISVLVLHAQLYTDHAPAGPFILLPAVPTFVALSGFLIPTSFGRSSGLGDFARKRFLRVLPAFAASWLLVLLLFGTKAVAPTLISYFTAGLIDFNYTFGNANVSLWSLIVEEVLYTYYALSRSIQRNWTVRAAWMALACAAAAWALCNPKDSQVWMIFDCVCSFLAGNILWFYRERPLDLRAVIIIAGLLFDAGLFMPRGCYQVILAVDAIFLADRLPRIKFWRADFSYGCYIYHAPIVLFLGRVCHWSLPAVIAGGLLTTLTISGLSWRFLEEPALRLKHSSMIRPGSTIAAAPDSAVASARRSEADCSTEAVPARVPERSDC